MSILKKNISVGNLKTKHLFLFKNYLGSQYGFRNKRLDEYLFGVDGTKNSLYDLDKTIVFLKRALNFLSLLKKKNSQFLIVGTSFKAQKLVKYLGESTNNPYVQRRWIKGLLTNWESTSSSIKFFNLFLTKLSLTKKKESKLKQTFGGLRHLTSLPDALLIIDIDSSKEAINEAKRLNIPIIAILDNNSKQVFDIDYPIYSNTGSTLPLFLIVSLIAQVLKN